MLMKVIPLGTNGFFAIYGRQTACFAIPLGKILIILDAGSGLFRLGEKKGGKLLTGVSDVHLYLSHYHLDHTFGFYAAFRLFKDKKVTVFAETERKVFSDLAKEYFPINFDKEYANFTWQRVLIGNNQVGNYEVKVRKQHHNEAGSLAFRFKFANGKELGYVTDSEPNYESADFVNGVDLLLHEHYLSGEEILKKPTITLEEHFEGKHVTSAGAAIIAKEAKVGKLALIHHFPFYDNERLEKSLRVARSLFPQTILAQDLKPIAF